MKMLMLIVLWLKTGSVKSSKCVWGPLLTSWFMAVLFSDYF